MEEQKQKINKSESDIIIDNKEQQENNKIELKEQPQNELDKNNNKEEEIKIEFKKPKEEETKNVILIESNIIL